MPSKLRKRRRTGATPSPVATTTPSTTAALARIPRDPTSALRRRRDGLRRDMAWALQVGEIMGPLGDDCQSMCDQAAVRAARELLIAQEVLDVQEAQA